MSQAPNCRPPIKEPTVLTIYNVYTGTFVDYCKRTNFINKKFRSEKSRYFMWRISLGINLCLLQQSMLAAGHSSTGVHVSLRMRAGHTSAYDCRIYESNAPQIEECNMIIDHAYYKILNEQAVLVKAGWVSRHQFATTQFRVRHQAVVSRPDNSKSITSALRSRLPAWQLLSGRKVLR